MNFMFLPMFSFPVVGTPGSQHHPLYLLMIHTNISTLHLANSYLSIFQEQQFVGASDSHSLQTLKIPSFYHPYWKVAYSRSPPTWRTQVGKHPKI